MISELCGFEKSYLERLPTDLRHRLGLKNALIFLSIILQSYSAFFIVSISIHDDYIAYATALLVFLILYFINAIFVKSSGSGAKLYHDQNFDWNPSKTRITGFLFFSLIFSQPLLIGINSFFHKNEIENYVDMQKKLRTEFIENSYKNKEEKILAEISRQKNYLNQINPGQTTESTAISINNGGTRKALLIGNQKYPDSPLNNPEKDASDLSKALQKIGFSTTIVKNGSKVALEMAIKNYLESLKPGDISLLFYSGHGFQNHGINYLVPVDFDSSNTSRAIGLNLVIEFISKKQPSASIVIIDACRSYSFGSGGGLASTEAGANTYIALAAKPGQMASDGRPGTNGVFTDAILKHIEKPIDIDDVFRNARKDVFEMTSNKQETWTSHNLSSKLVISSPEYINQNYIGDKRSHEQKLSLVTTNQCEIPQTTVDDTLSKQLIIDCHQKILLRLEDDLKMNQTEAQMALEKADIENQKKYTFRSILIPYYYSTRNSLLFMALGTFITTSLLVVGFYMRDHYSAEIIEYEKIANNENATFTSAQYYKTINTIARFPYTPPKNISDLESSPYSYHETACTNGKPVFSHVNDFIDYLKNNSHGEDI